jgi:hypothetical protein
VGQIKRPKWAKTTCQTHLPSSLADAHRKLDAAVFAAYGWPVTLADAELLERLLALNHERAAASQE